MSVFFVFSDEAGKYQKERKDKFLQANPYYCRAVVLLDYIDWKRLRQEFYELKKNMLNLEVKQEIKWSYIWSLYKYMKDNKEIPQNKSYYFLKNYDPEDLLKFVKESLILLNICNSSQIIYTITINDRTRTRKIDEKKIIRMHLQDIMQRAEMQIQAIPESLGILFFDPINSKTNKYLQEAYYSIYQKGDFIKNYSHIKDSIAFELSHHSVGIQLADYCAGILNGCLKNHENSIELFQNQIWDKIRRHYEDVWGYGILEIPKNSENREYLKNVIENNIIKKHEDIIPF